MKIIIKTLSKLTIVLNVEQTDTVENIKQKIENIYGFKSHNIRLIFAGKQIADFRSLQDYNIQKDQILHMILLQQGQQYINVETPSGMIELKTCEYSDFVENIKKKIEEQTQIPMDQQQLIYEGKELEDWSSLFDQNVKYGRNLKLNVIPIRNITLFVKLMSEKIISLKMSLLETIEGVKQKIEECEGIAAEQQILFFAGNKLENMNTLLECKIQRESTLHLKLKSDEHFEGKEQITNNNEQIKMNEEKCDQNITLSSNLQQSSQNNILSLLQSIPNLFSENEKIRRAKQIHALILQYNNKPDFEQNIDVNFCSGLMIQIESGTSQTQIELLNIIRTIALQGTNNNDNSKQNKFIDIFKELKLKKVIEEIMRREMKDEENEAKGGFVKYSEFVLRLFEIFSFINQNDDIRLQNIDSIGRFITNFFSNLIHILQNQKDRKENEEELVNIDANINQELNNGIRMFNALELITINNNVSKNLQQQYILLDVIIPFIHLNCSIELNCPYRISIPETSSTIILLASFYNNINQFFFSVDTISRQQIIEHHPYIISHISQNIITFVKDSTHKTTQHSTNSKIILTPTHSTINPIIQNLKFINFKGLQQYTNIDSYQITLNLLPYLISLSMYRVRNHINEKDNQQSTTLRYQSQSCLSNIYREGGEQIQKKLIQEYHYIQSLTSGIGTSGGSGEEYKYIIDHAIDGLCYILSQCFVKQNQIIFQIKKEIEEQLKEEGTAEEIEAMTFNKEYRHYDYYSPIEEAQIDLMNVKKDQSNNYW